MFDDLQKRLGVRLRPVPRAGTADRGATSRRACARSAPRCSRPTSTTTSSRSSWPGSTSRPSGPQLIKSVRPEQQIVKIVHDELVELMGPVDPSIRFEKSGPDDPHALRPPGLGQDDHLRQARAAARRAGPQAAARRGRPPAPGGRRAAQGHRPAARRPGLQPRPDSNPVKVCQDAVIEANRQGRDTIILDTAGRLHVDDELMAELTADREEGQAAPGLLRLRRPDRPGRRRLGRRLQQGARARRRDPDQARRRRPRRRGALGPAR